MREKQSMRLAGAPGIACVACFIFLRVVPGVNQSLQADRTAGHGGATSGPKASGPTDAWEDKGAHSVVSEPWPHLPRGGSVVERALARVCLWEAFVNVWRLGRQASFQSR